MGSSQMLTPQQWADVPHPDVYFNAAYAETFALLEPDVSHTLLLNWADTNGVVRLPLIVRHIPGTEFFDATSAYGYGGPWVEGSPNLEEFRTFFDEWAHEQWVVTTFLRFHPLLENAKQFANVLPVVHAGQTAAWDLADTTDLVAAMASNHRRNYRKAIRAGVEARITVHPTETATFQHIYEVAMSRLSASSYYHFSDEHWDSVRNKLGPVSVQADAVYQDRVIASVWCLTGEQYLHFHLNGTTDEARELRGAFVAHVGAAQWGQEHGYALAHLGGGYGGSDSALLDWKHRYSPATELRDFFIAKVIHDQQIYDQLAREFPATEYFPPWRAMVGESAKP